MSRKVATELKIELVRRGLVQADVARATQISEAKLSRILNGRALPTEYEIKALAKVLRLHRDQLLSMSMVTPALHTIG